MTRPINNRKSSFFPNSQTEADGILFSISASRELILKRKKIKGFRLILPPETMTSRLHIVFRFVRSTISFVFSVLSTNITKPFRQICQIT